MLNLMVKLQNMFRNEKGQGMVEYGLIIGLVAVVVIVALTALGGKVDGVFKAIATKLP